MKGFSGFKVVTAGVSLLIYAMLLPIINSAIEIALPQADEMTAFAIQMFPFIFIIGMIIWAIMPEQ
jgi:hypothetical protein